MLTFTPMSQKSSQGRTPLRGEAATSQFTLRMTPEIRSLVDDESQKTGASVNEVILRRIENAGSGVSTEVIRDMLRVAIQEMQRDQVCMSLEEQRRQQLEETAQRIGFADSAGLLKVMALKAINDPAFVEHLLSGPVMNHFRAAAQEELDQAKPKGKRPKAA